MDGYLQDSDELRNQLHPLFLQISGTRGVRGYRSTYMPERGGGASVDERTILK